MIPAGSSFLRNRDRYLPSLTRFDSRLRATIDLAVHMQTMSMHRSGFSQVIGKSESRFGIFVESNRWAEIIAIEALGNAGDARIEFMPPFCINSEILAWSHARDLSSKPIRPVKLAFP